MFGILGYLILGVCAGALSGLLGIGGGVVIVPALIYFFGLSQHLAQGTTLALLVPPIGILAAWTYYKHGFVDVRIALFICLGFLAGSLLGAKFAVGLPRTVLSQLFGFGLLLIGLKMIVFP